MHAALGGGDVVGERVDALVEAGVPLHRDVDLVVVAGVEVGDDPLEQRLLRRVEVLHEVADAAVELEVLREHRVDALVAEADLETPAEERHLAEALDQRLRPELGLLEDRLASGQNVIVVPCFFDGRDLGELVLGLAALREVLHPLAAVAVDLDVEAARQRVDHRRADAVQAARDLVALAAELPARVQHGHDDLGRRLALVLGVVVDGHAASVVGHAAAAVGQEGHVDAGAVTRHRLVDGVVDDLVDQVVEARSGRWIRCTSRAVGGPVRDP